MFETSVVRARAAAAPHRYRLLTLSLAFHAIAIVAVITATLASTRLPDEAPRQMSTPFLMPVITLPPALGTPHAQPQQQPKPRATAPAPSRADVAPAVIPDTTTTAGQPAAAVPDSGGMLSSTGTSTDGGGDPTGVIGGVGSVPATVTTPSAPIRIDGDVKAPALIHKVMPDYPRVAMVSRMNGWVIVECVIDRTGHIRDARVLKSSFAAFEQPALEAVQQWVFTPGSLHGEPVDVIFDLTVTFQLR